MLACSRESNLLDYPDRVQYLIGTSFLQDETQPHWPVSSTTSSSSFLHTSHLSTPRVEAGGSRFVQQPVLQVTKSDPTLKTKQNKNKTA